MIKYKYYIVEISLHEYGDDVITKCKILAGHNHLLDCEEAIKNLNFLKLKNTIFNVIKFHENEAIDGKMEE